MDGVFGKPYSEDVVLVDAFRQFASPEYASAKLVGITAFGKDKIIRLKPIPGNLVLARVDLLGLGQIKRAILNVRDGEVGD